MIDAQKRNAIFLLHQEGMSAREISRRLHLGRNTVRRVIAQEGRPLERASKPPPAALDPDLLRRLHLECDGYLQREYEKLREEHGVTITYSTLTRWMRKLGLTLPPATRCDRVPDEPGAEMQHDTSPYKIPLGGVTTKLQASLLYLRYSKRRYLQFYRVFDRFRMKCFLHRALLHWAYVPKLCVIDNTNLARLRGLGSNAVMVPEMEAFAKAYGLAFLCHARGHSDRKAGEERSFLTVETNFLPGRSFQNLEDLNHQCLRRLFALSQRMSPELFLRSVQRAHRYRITCRDTLERIARLYLSESQGELFASPTIDETFRERPAYQEGALTDLPNLSQYDSSSHDSEPSRPPA